MDTPVTRTKQQLIDFYVDHLDEFFGLSPSQYIAVRTGMVLLYGEVEDRIHPQYKQELERLARLDRHIVAMVEEIEEA